MLFSDSYFTIERSAESLSKDKGSKFLGFAYAVKNEAEIKECLAALKKLHPSANHHCYAWRLGADKLAFRANDDGEPSNSAGKPILAQIQSMDLTNVLVVVVRYFGGTLLGVGGLISAYRAAAAEVLSLAGKEERFILFEYKLSFDVEDTSPVMRLLKEYEAEITDNSYDEKSHLIFRIKKRDSETFENKLKELYRVKLEFLHLI